MSIITFFSGVVAMVSDGLQALVGIADNSGGTEYAGNAANSKAAAFSRLPARPMI
jgi:hypothetical protein